MNRKLPYRSGIGGRQVHVFLNIPRHRGFRLQRKVSLGCDRIFFLREISESFSCVCMEQNENTSGPLKDYSNIIYTKQSLSLSLCMCVCILLTFCCP